jgi:hypothetical protein
MLRRFHGTVLTRASYGAACPQFDHWWQVVASFSRRRMASQSYADRSSVDIRQRRYRRSWHLSRVVKSGGCPGV